MSTPIETLIKACEDSWDKETVAGVSNSNNCSGFLRSVAALLNKPLLVGRADDLVDYIRQSWVKVATASDAAKDAAQGMLVVAGLKGSEHSRVRNSGHVAVIVPGTFYANKYPRCWCGSTSTAQSKGNKSVGEVWSQTDRDKVTYHRAP